MYHRQIKLMLGRRSSPNIIPLLGLAALLLLGVVALNPLAFGQVEEAHAETSSGTNLLFNGDEYENPVIGLAIDGTDENNVANTFIDLDKEGGFGTISTKVNVEVSKVSGFGVYINGNSAELSGKVASNTLKLTGVGENVARDNFADNTWGYSFQDITGGTESDAKTLSYSTMPTVRTRVAEVKSDTGNDTTEVRATKQYQLAFAAKMGANAPADVYGGQVTVSVLANPLRVVTGLASVSYMQDLTQSICAEAKVGETKQLIDRRDGKTYWVAKMADGPNGNGNCWMTQNLALNLQQGTAIEGSHYDTNAGRYVGFNYSPDASTRTPDTANRFSIPYNQWMTGEKDACTDESTCLNRYSYYSWNEGEYVVIYPGAGHAGLWMGMKDKDSNTPLGDGTSGVQDGLSSFGNPKAIIQACLNDSNSKDHCESLKTSPVFTKYGVVMDVSGPNWTASTDPKFTSSNKYIDASGTERDKTEGWSIACTQESADGTKCLAGVYDAHYMVGNYYQWLVANGLTVEQGAGLTTGGDSSNSSICPAGWQLPYSGSYGSDLSANGLKYNARSGSFFNLIKTYAGSGLKTGGTAGGADSANTNNGYSSLSYQVGGLTGDLSGYNGKTVEQILTGEPLYFLRAGDVNPWASYQQVRDVGAGAYFWSSVVNSPIYAQSLYFNPYSVYPSNINHRLYGFSLRCLLLG